eukprot:3410108-Rhodomonas_salina.1
MTQVQEEGSGRGVKLHAVRWCVEDEADRQSSPLDVEVDFSPERFPQLAAPRYYQECAGAVLGQIVVGSLGRVVRAPPPLVDPNRDLVGEGVAFFEEGG